MLIHGILLFLSGDSSLGKFNKNCLSQQTLMEYFIEGIGNRETLCGSKENPTDISEWPGLSFTDTGEVLEIDWQFFELDGSLSLEWLPLTITKVYIFNTPFAFEKLGGSIDLTQLPDSLIYLSLSCSEFSEAIDLTRLPSKMKDLTLRFNSLSGMIDLTMLPDTVESLLLDNNKFHGITDFSKLPQSLKTLDVSNNINLGGDIRMREGGDYTVISTQVKVVE